MTLLEVVGREDRSVAAGAHRLRLLHRLLTLVSAARAREREAEVVRRGHVVRFFVERGTKGRNRIGLAPLLKIDLSGVDEGADVARIELADARERLARRVETALRARDESQDVRRTRIARQQPRGVLDFTPGAIEIERIEQRDGEIHSGESERRAESKRRAERFRGRRVIELLEPSDADVVRPIGILDDLELGDGLSEGKRDDDERRRGENKNYRAAASHRRHVTSARSASRRSTLCLPES